jgi:multidrug resistance efflux pump
MTELEDAEKDLVEIRAKCDTIDAQLRGLQTAHDEAWKAFDKAYWVWERLRREARNHA